MINANDVINFIQKLIDSRVKMNVSTNTYFSEINTSDVRIYTSSYDNNNEKYVAIQFYEYNNIIVHDLTEKEWLGLKRMAWFKKNLVRC